MSLLCPKLFVLAVALLSAPTPCLALWSVAEVTPEQATKLGIVVQSKAAGPKDVRVELQFAIAGELEDFDRVDLRLGEPNDTALTAALKEERSKDGRATVSFLADRAQLGKVQLWIMVPQARGGVVYAVRVRDFVEVERDE